MADNNISLFRPNKNASNEIRRLLEFPFSSRESELKYVSHCLWFLCVALEEADSPSEMLKPLQRVADALDDLEGGTQPEILTASRTRNPGLSSSKANKMAFGALAISASPRNEMRDTCNKASKMLGISANKLWNFRKKLMQGPDGSLKSESAHQTYETGLYICRNLKKGGKEENKDLWLHLLEGTPK